MTRVLLMLAVAIPSIIFTARAGTVTLPAASDNTLYESATGAWSNGAGESFFCGRTNGLDSLRRGLLFFDVAAGVPAGATITAARLELSMTKTLSLPNLVHIHAARTAWGEGASDAPLEEGGGTTALPGDATWLHAVLPGSLWQNAGGDFDATALASATVGLLGDYAWSSAALTATLQQWLVTPASNLGFFVIGDESSFATSHRFATRENPMPALRPRLVVEFCSAAGWQTYGAGWPGTNGVPAMTLSANPQLGTNLTLDISNSAGAPALTFLLVGLQAINVPTGLGGTLLVQPILSPSFVLPAGTTSLPVSVPNDPTICTSVFVQAIEADAGASQGAAFTAGLEIVLGV